MIGETRQLLTGGDKFKVMKKHGAPIVVEPMFTVHMYTNFPPVMGEGDSAMNRRQKWIYYRKIFVDYDDPQDIARMNRAEEGVDVFAKKDPTLEAQVQWGRSGSHSAYLSTIRTTWTSDS